VYNVINLKKK
jgi:T-complex protein 1 subunit delta